MRVVNEPLRREKIKKARVFSQVVLSIEKDGAGTPSDLAERLGITRTEAKEAIRAAIEYGLIRTIRKEYGDLCVIWR